MLRAALHRFGRLGFVGALLLALATVALPVESQACAPAATGIEAAASDAAIAQTDPCGEDGCGDCTAACAHGCCHAPHLAVVAQAAAPPTPTGLGEPLVLPEPVAVRLPPASALERPPRA